jgi:hypothetical protein
MFLVSMADIIGSYERLPNDAVRAVAVAKRREYWLLMFIGDGFLSGWLIFP